MKWYYRPENWDNYTIPYGFFDDVKHYCNSPRDDIAPVIYLTIAFTVARYAFEILFRKVNVIII